MKLLLALSPILTALAGECYPVVGDRILGSDLKAATHGFEALEDRRVVALAPAPGVRRVFTPADLQSFGRPARELCFERSGEPIRKEAAAAAMQNAFDGRQVRIGIEEIQQGSLPTGTLEFPLTTLSRPPPNRPDAAVIWRGHLRLENGRSIPVWARVRVTEQREWVESAAPLVPGRAVEPGQVRTRVGEVFPLTAPLATDPNLFIGRSPRRSIAPGVLLNPAMFEEPFLILKGDTVDAMVASGAVSLRFDARAETSGRLNDSILIYDPAQSRRLKAQVAGKGKVVIHARQPNDISAHRGTAGAAFNRIREKGE